MSSAKRNVLEWFIEHDYTCTREIGRDSKNTYLEELLRLQIEWRIFSC